MKMLKRDEIWGYNLAICKINKEEELYFEKFGYYDGEWILVTYDKEEDLYKIYKDYFGSCSGCDAMERFISGLDMERFISGLDMERFISDSDIEDTIPYPQVEEFVSRFPPFISIPSTIFKILVEHNELQSLLPANLSIYNCEDNIQDLSKKIGSNILEHYYNIISKGEAEDGNK